MLYRVRTGKGREEMRSVDIGRKRFVYREEVEQRGRLIHLLIDYDPGPSMSHGQGTQTCSPVAIGFQSKEHRLREISSDTAGKYIPVARPEVYILTGSQSKKHRPRKMP